MTKILLTFGTRPEAIKMCPLVNELKKRGCFDVRVCVTGQHREMLDMVLDAFDVKPDYDLSVMKENQSLFDITTGVLRGMEMVLDALKPDIVLVHGDTATTFAASLACYYKQIPVGHVEAGLRTHNIYSPYPEEFDRQAVDIIAKYYFAPTETAKQNLINEGKDKSCIWVTGNTGIDALRTTVKDGYRSGLTDWAGDSKLILLTAHRRENIGEKHRRIFRAVKKISEEFNNVKIIYPVHPSSKVKAVAEEILGGAGNVMLTEPLDVIDFHNIMAKSYMILTDSGGIQEEAPSLGKPVLVLRDTTERPEGIEAGTLMLAGTDETDVYESIKKLLTDPTVYTEMSRASNPYGDGHSSEKIADILTEILK